MPHIDAVLPLLPRDLERFAILARSLQRFFSDLGTLYVVVPDGSVEALREPVRRRAPGLPVELVPERRWVPDMGSFQHLPGWYKQQLIKIAAAEAVSSDFFLTLDADIVCTRKVDHGGLVVDGRAACYVIPKDEHPDWYVGAEAVLDVRAKRQGILHNVTPCVCSKQGMLELIEHLNEVARRRPWASGIRGMQQRLFFTKHRLGAFRKEPPWRGWLAASRPWAEYATYYTFLEATGRFDRWHFDTDTCIYDIERSVWWKTTDYATWDPAPLFAGSGPPYFVVIQSNTRIAPERTWSVLEPWLGAPDPAWASS